jgi:hypothetical protein
VLKEQTALAWAVCSHASGGPIYHQQFQAADFPIRPH